MLLRAARAVAEDGHRITFVQTCAPEPHYDASESDFARLADEMGAPLVTGTVGRHLDLWRRSGTDVCISLNWPTLVPERALAVFAHGILNAHAGDLPRYRGNACPNWAILNFEDRVGLTIHRMVAELDAGPWLHKSFLPIDEGTYIGDIYRWLEDAIPSGFQEAIARTRDRRLHRAGPAGAPAPHVPAEAGGRTHRVDGGDAEHPGPDPRQLAPFCRRIDQPRGRRGDPDMEGSPIDPGVRRPGCPRTGMLRPPRQPGRGHT